MRLSILSVSDLIEHPKNKEYFQDISGEFWKIFLEDIRENGIKEPLTVNTKTMHVVKGNQRLRAALVLGITEVPCLLTDIDNEDQEIEELIRDNVLRRDIDVFTKFQLVNRLRDRVKARPAGRPSNDDKNNSAENRQNLEHPRDRIATVLNESKDFITAADLFNSLPPEKQQEMREWFYSQDNTPTQKSMKEQLDILAGRVEAREKQLDEILDHNGELEKKNDDLVDTVETLQEDISRKEKQIQKLMKDINDNRDAERIKEQIEDLKKQRNSFQEELDEIRELAGLQVDVRNMLKKLAPVRYSRLFQRDQITAVTRNTVNELLDEVQAWIDDVAYVMENTKVIEVS